MKDFIVLVDFDGTLCHHAFPEIGVENPMAMYWLSEFQRLGAKLILWTMRGNVMSGVRSPEGHAADRRYLLEAVEWCAKRGIEFWGVNQNPTQGAWTDSPKPYAQVIIDDTAFGCPMLPYGEDRGLVNWSIVGPLVALMIQKAIP